MLEQDADVEAWRMAILAAYEISDRISLANLATEDAMDPYNERMKRAYDISSALVARGLAGLSLFIPYLKDENPLVRLDAAITLNRDFPELVRPVLEELRDLEPRDFGDDAIDGTTVHIHAAAAGTLRYMQTGDIADYWSDRNWMDEELK